MDEIRALIRSGEFPSASTRASQLLREVEATHDSLSLPVALVLDLVVKATYSGAIENEQELVEAAQRAVRIKENFMGRNDVRLAESLVNLGIVQRKLEHFAEARVALDRALAILEAALGPDHLDVADVLQHLATLATEMGSYEEASPLFARTLSIREAQLGPRHRDLAQPLFNYARVLVRTSRYDEARRRYQQALDIARTSLGEDHPGVAYILNGSANLHLVLGEYNAAREEFEAALAIAEPRLGSAHALVTACKTNLGVVCKELGDYERSRTYYQQALQESDALHTSDKAKILARKAYLEYLTGDMQGALSHYAQALAEMETALGAEHPDIALSLVEYGEILIASGQFDSARNALKRSESILEKVYGPENEHVALPVVWLAEISRRTGDLRDAEQSYRRAYSIQERTLGPTHPRLSPTLRGLALVLAQRGVAAEGVDLALRAERIARDHVRLTIRALPEREALNHASRVPGGLDVAWSMALDSGDAKLLERVWDESIRSRALVLDEMATRHGTLLLKDRKTLALTEELSRTTRELAHLLFRGPEAVSTQSYLDAVESARKAQERAQKALASKSATQRTRLAQEKIGLDDIRGRLPAGAALLAFVRYRNLELSHPMRDGGTGSESTWSILAIVLTGAKAAPVAIPLGTATEIDTLVSNWTAEISGTRAARQGQLQLDESRCRQAGNAVRARIWDPVSPALGSATRVFIVPEGSLNLVSFAALPNGEAAYLVDKGIRTHYLSAERDLVAIPDRAKGSVDLFVLGGPDFDTADTLAVVAAAGAGSQQETVEPDARREWFECANFAALQLRPLPGSLTESRELAELWSSARRDARIVHFDGPSATEAAVRQYAPHARVCHLATHGFFLNPACASAPPGTRLMGGLSSDPGFDLAPLARTNPMLFAGLVLAGANRHDRAVAEDDGILTAEEITAMDLGSMDWAVLSACGTGLGVVRTGEGVFGLRRAFRVAGARTVIMSLWSVSDAGTLEWMQRLYERRLGGAEAPEAVFGACRDVLTRRRAAQLSTHPFYWAGFVASGEWR